MIDRSIPFLFLLLTILTTAPTGDAIADVDVVTMRNGDRLSGELKSLERGKLRFDTIATGTIPIEWDEVATLVSFQNVQIETSAGARYLGTLSTAQGGGSIIVRTAGEPVFLEIDDVVLMTPIKKRGLDRIDAGVTFGYTFAKSSEVQQLNLGFDSEARTEKRLFALNADVTISDADNAEANQRKSLDLSYTRLWSNRWATGAVVRVDRNDELDVDLRTSLGAGGGRYVIQSNAMTLLMSGGVQLTRENVGTGLSDNDTVEGFLGANWDWFRYDSPELDLTSNLLVFPNLTDTGRVRSEFDVTFRWEMIADLFWQVSYYNSYDSDPVVDGAEKNDYGIITSLGYSF